MNRAAQSIGIHPNAAELIGRFFTVQRDNEAYNTAKATQSNVFFSLTKGKKKQQQQTAAAGKGSKAFLKLLELRLKVCISITT